MGDYGIQKTPKFDKNFGSYYFYYGRSWNAQRYIFVNMEMFCHFSSPLVFPSLPIIIWLVFGCTRWNFSGIAFDSIWWIVTIAKKNKEWKRKRLGNSMLRARRLMNNDDLNIEFNFFHTHISSCIMHHDLLYDF